MRYFPLSSDSFEHQFGIRALGNAEPIVEATPRYDAEIAVKRDSLTRDRDYYFQATHDSLAAQADAVSLIVKASSFLSESHNLRSGESLAIDSKCPLLSVSRHVQEDLTILRHDPDAGFPLIAGSVCFPSGWCISDKIGLNIADIHAPVPQFASVLAEATNNLLRRLKVGRPVWRTNWGVRPSGQLDQTPRHRAMLDQQTSLVTAQTAGERCYFRVERQTLARLPASGDILFAIHTHQQTLSELETHEQRCLLSVIRSCPDETLAYKGILPMRIPIESFLESASEA